MSDREEFLAGGRPEDVLMYFADEAVSGVEALAERGERVDGGVILVVDGEKGRSAFESAVGVDPMQFAKRAMGSEGMVYPDCTGGVCPKVGVPGGGAEGNGESGEGGGEADDTGDDHDARFVFAFAEEQNEEVDGLYQEGDVIHAYVSCTCGEAYSDKWLAGEK